MTRAELIKLVGDTLTQIDTRLGSIDPRSPEAAQLWQLRMRLDEYQRTLVAHAIRDTGNDYVDANKALEDATKVLKTQLAEVNALKAQLAAVANFVGAVGNLLKIGGALLA